MRGRMRKLPVRGALHHGQNSCGRNGLGGRCLRTHRQYNGETKNRDQPKAAVAKFRWEYFHI